MYMLIILRRFMNMFNFIFKGMRSNTASGSVIYFNVAFKVASTALIPNTDTINVAATLNSAITLNLLNTPSLILPLSETAVTKFFFVFQTKSLNLNFPFL